MPQINLLPWREELRKRRQKDFLVVAGIVMVIAGAALGGVYLHFEERIAFQGKRNEFLQSEIAKLDVKINEIEDLERQKDILLKRMDIIEQLQSSRPEIVKVVDQLVSAQPDGIFYTRILQKGRQITLDGVAQSNARVSSLMRNLDKAEAFQDPKLQEIKAQEERVGEQTLRLAKFQLVVAQRKKEPKPSEEEAAPRQAKKRR